MEELVEIKQFSIISSTQKMDLYNFIKNADLTYNKRYIEMIKIYESDTFNDGKTVFIVFHKGKIKGSMAFITKEVSIKGEAFITDIYIERENQEILLKILIEEVTKYCKTYNTKSIKIGIRECEKHLINYIDKFGFNHVYDAVIMRYKQDKSKVVKANNGIELKPLCISNSQEFMKIHNEAFKNSPNAGTIDEVEVKDYIVQYANEEDFIGICFKGNNPCGIYELSREKKAGWIDTLAIAPDLQNIGLGKALLVKCIEKLYHQNLSEVKLLVITSNKVAMNVYENMGFNLESVFSYWFEKKLKK